MSYNSSAFLELLLIIFGVILVYMLMSDINTVEKKEKSEAPAENVIIQ